MGFVILVFNFRFFGIFVRDNVLLAERALVTLIIDRRTFLHNQ